MEYMTLNPKKILTIEKQILRDIAVQLKCCADVIDCQAPTRLLLPVQKSLACIRAEILKLEELAK
jgi:hypothetical protein